MDRSRAQTPDGGLEAGACQELRAALPAYARGELAAGEALGLRAHLVRCPACAAEYRRSIEGQARRGRGLRGGPSPARGSAASAPTRVEPSRDRADVGPSPDPPASRVPAAARRRRRLRLRTVLLPALFVGLFLQVAGVTRRAPRIVVEAARGEVTVAERPYESYERPPTLGRGIWCHTREGGTATLVAPGARLVQDAWSSVQAETPEPLRVRLRAGSLTVEGRATVVTWIGVVDFEGGAGRVALVREGLELSCAAGSLEYDGPLGSRALGAGQSVRLTR